MNEREQFEKHINDQRWLKRMLNRRGLAGSQRLGEYVDHSIQVAWEAWQARAALTPPQASPATVAQEGWTDFDNLLAEIKATPEGRALLAAGHEWVRKTFTLTTAQPASAGGAAGGRSGASPDGVRRGVPSCWLYAG